MIVYGEMLFAENCIIGGVLLWITAQIHGGGFAGWKDRMKLLAGALLCGGFSFAIFLPVKALLTILLETGFAFLVCFLLFGGKKVWQKALTFLLVTYFMGGMTMGLLLVTNHMGMYTTVGIYTGDLKAGMLALFVGLSCFTARHVIRTVSEKKFYREHRYEAEIVVGERSVSAGAFLDTGNDLTEPVSGRPVAVAGEFLWIRMERAGMLETSRFCMVPYETVGGRGLLEAVRVDALILSGRRLEGCVIAKGSGVAGLEKSRGTEEGAAGKSVAEEAAGSGAAGWELLLSRHMADRTF